MAYDPLVVKAARERLDARRSDAIAHAGVFREQMCARFPRLAEIEREMTGTLPEITRIILDGGDPDAMARVRARNLELQNEMALLLHAAGSNRDNFEPVFTCPLCGDTGSNDGKICDCYRQLLREEACKRLSGLSATRLTDFNELETEYYDTAVDPKSGVSVRERMAGIIEYCRNYAEQFTPDADSLLLQGSTGTGKTHLSLAIAKTVTARGYGVIYGSLQPLLRRIESEHFGRAEGNSEEQLFECDLLILDDLGMEQDTPFYRTEVYAILNTRLLEGRPTIISTNLSLAAIRDRYGEQIASRITGGYQTLLFAGKDMRQVLRLHALR